MNFGWGNITCQRYPGDEREEIDLYREALELAEQAEALGFDSVWCGEHHFIDDSYLPSLMVLCAAIAARTSRIRIGTHVLLAPLHNTLRLAEDAAVADLISRGRLIFGIGQGWRPEEFDGFQIPLIGRHRYFTEQVAVLRQAWSEGLVNWEGEHLHYADISVTPKPVQSGGPPIWIGGSVESSVRRAARIGDGLIAAGMGASPPFASDWPLTLDTFAEHVGWVHEELHAAGRDPRDYSFALSLPVLAWEDETVWKRAKEHLWYSIWKYSDIAEARGRAGPPAVPPPSPSERQAKFHEHSLLGSPDAIIEQLRLFDEVAGGRLHFIARMYWPGLDSGLLRESMAVFAERVMQRMRTPNDDPISAASYTRGT
jgi:probable F420-dependent oxidoreductase